MSSAILRTISSARRSVSRRTASSACRCARISAVTGSPFPAPGCTLLSGISPHTLPPVMATGFHGRPSPAIRTTTPLSGFSRAIRTPSCMLPASRLSPLRLPCRATNCASSLPFTRPSPVNPRSPAPSSVVSGFSQIPADLPLRSNAGSATYGCGYLRPGAIKRARLSPCASPALRSTARPTATSRSSRAVLNRRSAFIISRSDLGSSTSWAVPFCSALLMALTQP
ncbi:Uncharacterised protein [Salmonella enterica subsp. enterica serovar Bovismorbificans]|uniref:Uncharacterized protein n=1 Tax=Salmonella enterica subsp. enterica serovar Bovismorbificans TaxID=58097 RepID=A0A655DY07_SALET|nr:Uncharacterised protein [Salmonella enterica subsp. enterica serovar Bovismorbificans]